MFIDFLVNLSIYSYQMSTLCKKFMNLFKSATLKYSWNFLALAVIITKSIKVMYV